MIETQLKRELGIWSAAAIVVGTVIGIALARAVPTINFWVAICICGYAERIVVEAYKLVRAQLFKVYKPGKFVLADPRLLGARLGFKKVI